MAVPLIVSIMEAQPIALVLVLIHAGTTVELPLEGWSIALLALCLLWWAMLVERVIRPLPLVRRRSWLHALGWLVAFVVLVGPRLPFVTTGANFFAALVETTLVTWLWRRSIPRAQAGFEYESLALAFKISFGVLLGILVLVILVPGLPTLRDALGKSLPVFFLSGLVGLSLVRLTALRGRRRALDGSRQSDPTRAWLLALTLLGVALVVFVLVVEAVFSFTSFEAVLATLTPLWNALGVLLSWLLYAVIFLLSPLFSLFSWLIGLLANRHGQTTPQRIGPKLLPISQPWSPQSIPPTLLTLGRWFLLGLSLLVVLAVVRASLRRWRLKDQDEGIEEVCESLDARSLLGERWHTWWSWWKRKTGMMATLEALDPASARARYRELLQTMAIQNEELARTAAETPAEYEARLLTQVIGGEAPPDRLADDAALRQAPAILHELTRAYVAERYGGKQANQRQQAYLQANVPCLIARLTTNAWRERPGVSRLPKSDDRAPDHERSDRTHRTPLHKLLLFLLHDFCL